MIKRVYSAITFIMFMLLVILGLYAMFMQPFEEGMIRFGILAACCSLGWMFLQFGEKYGG
jgi:hypothetical protein